MTQAPTANAPVQKKPQQLKPIVENPKEKFQPTDQDFLEQIKRLENI